MIRIAELRTNGCKTPLGDDGRPPLFTWQLHSDDRIESGGIRAARVRVASTPEGLSDEHACLWDSGEFAGTPTSLKYGGSPLAGGETYWWRVTVTDAQRRTVDSEPARFDTGLRAGQWQAKWIWSAERGRSGTNEFVYFRKEIEARAPVISAKMYVSAHNYMKVFVNGARVTGLVSPASTDPVRRKYYLVYDVASCLIEGANCLSAIVHYLGGSGQNYVNGKPGLRMQLKVDYADGTSELVATDRTWDVLTTIPHRTGTPYQQNRRISAIEDYDAAVLHPGWQLPGWGQSASWRAECAKAAEVDIAPDEWEMVWQPIPEGAVAETIVPVPMPMPAVPEDEAGDRAWAQVFDAGRIVSGWPSLSLPGVAGAVVRMRYSEALDDAGFVRRNVANETSETYYDQYRMRGDSVDAVDAVEHWEPDFSYKAFRYVEVTGYPHPIVPGEQLRIASAHTALAPVGQFRCSSELLNGIYDASIRTQSNNMLGQTVDCPHREQAQYLADTDLQAEAMLYNFDGAPLLLEKALGDFGDGQRPDGSFPFVYPSNNDHPDFNLHIPEWDLHFCTLMWKIYLFTGDTGVLERHYPAAKRMADHYAASIDPVTGLVRGGGGWHISDWPYPTVDHASDFLAVQNMKLYAALRVLADAAELLGLSDDRMELNRIAHELRDAIQAQLFDQATARFRGSLSSARTHQGVTALALHLGLVPPEHRERALRFIAESPWEARTVLSLPLLRALFDGGDPEAAYRLIDREEYPGWGYMIRQGAATMWEGWDDIESHSHAWNGYPARLLQEYVAGIRALAPGFSRVRIKPYAAAKLSFAEARAASPKGLIHSRWERAADGGSVRLQTSVPPAVQAFVSLELPPGAGAVRRICESGTILWERTAADEAVPELPIGSGNYDFRYELAR